MFFFLQLKHFPSFSDFYLTEQYLGDSQGLGNIYNKFLTTFHI